MDKSYLLSVEQVHETSSFSIWTVGCPTGYFVETFMNGYNEVTSK